MSTDPRPEPEAGPPHVNLGAGGTHVDARGAKGVMIGEGNLQINYFQSYDKQTWSDHVAPPPLVSVRGTVDSPYRGLSSFRERDAPFFFGREVAATAVLERMSRSLAEPGLLMVSGTSGAGKSSLLRAGVLPRLRGDGLASAPGSESWTCLFFTPGPAPLDELAVQLERLAVADAAPAERATDPAGFALTARRAALKQQGATAEGPDDRDLAPRRLLLIVDQFERLFTQCPDEGQRQAFIAALNAAATLRHGPEQVPAAVVVLGVRADFEARCASYEPLAASIQDRYLLMPMNRRELQLAITGPAGLVESAVTDELVDVLLRDVMSRPSAVSPGGPDPGAQSGAGVLPLLSYALDQSWRNRIGNVLTLTDYARTGGLERAVAASAQDTYDRLTQSQQREARLIFTRLTATSRDGLDIASRATRAELRDGKGQAAAGDVDAVLEAFAAERLLTLAADFVEIAHEVLLTAWPLLHDVWLAETHEDRTVRSRLHYDAVDWDRDRRHPSHLYSGHLREAAGDTVARINADPSRYPPLAQLDRDFLRASELADLKRKRRRRGLFAALTALVVVAGVVTGVAVSEGHTASSERYLAASNELAGQSQSAGGSDPALARLEAVAAWHLDPTPRAGFAMLKAALLPATATLETLAGLGPVAFSPDGKLLAVSTKDSTQVWDVATRQLTAALPRKGIAVEAHAMAFSPDGKLLVVGIDGAGIQVWNVATRHLVATLANNGGAISAVAFSPDGTLLADIGTYGPQLWDVATHRLVATLPYTDTGFAVAFSPDGKLLAVGNFDATQLWDVATRHLAVTLPDGANSVAFSPDGKLLAIDTSTLRVHLWDMATDKLAGALPYNGQPATAMAFSPDSESLAVGTSGGGLQLWHVATAQLATTLPENGATVVSLAFSPDGKFLAIGAQGTVQLLNTAAEPALSAASATLPAKDHAGYGIVSQAFSPDGKLLAVDTEGAGIQVWNVATRQLAATFPDGVDSIANSPLASMAFSPDSERLAVATGAGIQVWDVAADHLTATFPVRFIQPSPAQGQVVVSVAFSPDGKLLAAGTYTGIQVWDTVTRGLAATFSYGSRHPVPITAPAMMFSPDGKLLVLGTTAGVQLWNLATRHLAATIPHGSNASVSATLGWGSLMAFSPGGKFLAIDTDTGIQVWDVASDDQVASFALGGEAVSAMALNPDATVLAIDNGRQVQLWDLAAGQEAGVLAGGATPAPTLGHVLSFSPGGTLLAVAATGDSVQLWNVPYLVDVPSYLCSVAAESFPRAVWAKYAPGVPYQQTCP